MKRKRSQRDKRDLLMLVLGAGCALDLSWGAYMIHGILPPDRPGIIGSFRELLTKEPFSRDPEEIRKAMLSGVWGAFRPFPM